MPLPLNEAVICYLRRSSETLLIDYTSTQHPIHKGKFSAPGGKMGKAEKATDATRREVEEETGILARDLIYRGKVLFRNENRTIRGKPMPNNWLVYFFDCYDFDERNAHDVEGKLTWCYNDRVLSLPIHEGDRIIWEKWLSQEKEFSGEIVHEGETLVSANLV